MNLLLKEIPVLAIQLVLFLPVFILYNDYISIRLHAAPDVYNAPSPMPGNLIQAFSS